MGAELSMREVGHLRGGRTVLTVDRLDIARGERLAVLGPNGAGKTSLLRLLAAVDTPRSGEVAVDGERTHRPGVGLRRKVAYVTQQPGLLSTSVRRNVELPLRWRKVSRNRRRDLATAALDRLRIGHLADRPARTLSGGEQQRVSLARALALDPGVLLLDEPAAGLDAQSRVAFLADLERVLEDRATTVVHVSHRAEEALRLADRVAVLVEGEVRQVDTPAALHRRPADVSVAALVGYENLLDARVEPDGTVSVSGEPTGLVSDRADGTAAAAVAVFASGLRPVDTHTPGLSARVARVTPGPGHHVVALEGPVSLLAHLPVGVPAPSTGDVVRVRFDPRLSVVLPAAGSPDRQVVAPGGDNPSPRRPTPV